MLIFVVVFLSHFVSYSQNWELVKNLDSNANGNKWVYTKSYNDKNVIIVGEDFNGIPRVIISDDAGKNWKYIYNTAIEEYFKDFSLKYHKPYAVHYDKDKIFILAYDYSENQRYYIISTDKGKTWKKEKTNIGGNDIYFDANTGVILAFDKLFYSTDSGNSWIEKPNNINNYGNIEKVRFSSVNKFQVLMVDQKNLKAYIYQTLDMAVTWKIDTIPYYCRYVSFSFLDDNNCFVVGSYSNGTGDTQNDVILKTTDNCKTWQKVLDNASKDSISLPFGLYDIEVISKNQIIAVGSTLRAIYSNDGGLSWNLLTKGLEKATYTSLFYSVKFLKPNVIIACGWDNIIARNDIVINSVDDNGKGQENTLNLYPNPVSDYLTINANQEIGKIEIFSTLGLKVLETEWKEKIDVRNLPEGIYFLIIKSGNVIETKKFAIIR
jgi:photosystem II stability/assembly factor-like uncharacterized protein